MKELMEVTLSFEEIEEILGPTLVSTARAVCEKSGKDIFNELKSKRTDQAKIAELQSFAYGASLAAIAFYMANMEGKK